MEGTSTPLGAAAEDQPATDRRLHADVETSRIRESVAQRSIPMRILFDIAVAGSLAYLLANQYGASKPVPEGVSRVLETSKEVAAVGKQLVGIRNSEPAPTVETKSARVETKSAPEKIAKDTADSVPAVSKREEAEKPAANIAPEAAPKPNTSVNDVKKNEGPVVLAAKAPTEETNLPPIKEERWISSRPMARNADPTKLDPIVPSRLPAARQNRGEPAMPSAQPETPVAIDTSTLMKPAERLRELHRLAEEMELLFVDKARR